MTKRLTALILLLTLTVMLFTACGGNTENDENSPGPKGTGAAAPVPTGFVYVPEYATVSGDMFSGYQSTALIDDTLYYFSTGETFASGGGTVSSSRGYAVVGAAISLSAVEGMEGTADETEPPPNVGETDQPAAIPELKMYAAKLDGSAPVVVEGYRPPQIPEGYSSTDGNFYIQSLTRSSDGALWVGENGSFGTWNDDYSKFDGVQVSQYRKISTSGEELAVIDTASLSSNGQQIYIQNITDDKDGNIFVTTYGSDDAHALIAFSPDGTKLFEIPYSYDNNYIQQLFTMTDGRAGVLVQKIDANGYGMHIVPVDVTAKSLGESMGALPQQVYQIDGFTEDGRVLAHNQMALYAFEPGSTELETIVNWIDSDVDSNDLQSVTITGDNIVLTGYDWSTDQPKLNIITLKKTPAADVKQKTVLTLACIYLDYYLRSDIIKFNKTDPDYRIKVIDYSIYNTQDDYRAGYMKLNTEIISGQVPDMIYLDGMVSYNTYAIKGVLEDLYPFLDADTELGGRSAVVPAVLNAMEHNNGKLYRIASAFNVSTSVGRSDLVGEGIGWTLAEANAALAKAGEGASIYGGWANTRMYMMNNIYTYVMQDFIDWSTGKVSLNSPEFIDTLDYIKTFPAEYDYNFRSNRNNEYLDLHVGKTLLSSGGIGSFSDLMRMNAILGGKIAFKGFPCDSRNGSALSLQNTIAMSSTCTDKDGVWKFMRTLLLPTDVSVNTNGRSGRDWSWSFPSNAQTFEALAAKAMTEFHEGDRMEEITYQSGGWGSSSPESFPENTGNPIAPRGKIQFEGSGLEPIYYYAMTQAEYDNFLAFLNTINRTSEYDQKLQELVDEELQPFWENQKTAQQVCDIIQSKVDTYVNEQR